MTFIESDVLWLEALIHLGVVYVSDCAASVSGELIKPRAFDRTRCLKFTASETVTDTSEVSLEEIEGNVV